MILYLKREKSRLKGILTASNSVIVPPTATPLTQPLVIEPPMSSPNVESQILNDVPIPYTFPFDDNDFNSEENTQIPELIISPIIKSTIPKIILKPVPQKRNPPKKIIKYNRFDNMDWEEINTHLHGIYGNAKLDGCLCLDDFDVHAASADYDDLMDIDSRNLADFFLVKTWINKIKYAIMACPDSDAEESDF